MRTVLYLNPSSILGGAEQSLLGLVTHLEKTLFSPLVVVPHPGPLVEQLQQAGIRTRCIHPGRWMLRLSRRLPFLDLALSPLALAGFIKALVQLRRLILKENVLLIHTNGIKAHLLGGIAGRWTGHPVICHLRDVLGESWLDRGLRWGIRHLASVIIAPSEAVAQRIGRGRSKTLPLEVVPNGIDLERWRPPPLPSNPAEEQPLEYQVGILGPLTPCKGQEIFLQAAKLVTEEIGCVRFFIVGDNSYETWDNRNFRKQLERRVDALGLQSHVTFTGLVQNPMDWIQRFDVIVSASVKPEGFGRVLLEAMTLAKPVVATATGAHPEIVEDGKTGVLVPPGAPEAMADAICRILKDRDLRQRMGPAGRRRAEERFSLTRHVQSIERIYRGILE